MAADWVSEKWRQAGYEVVWGPIPIIRLCSGGAGLWVSFYGVLAVTDKCLLVTGGMKKHLTIPFESIHRVALSESKIKIHARVEKALFSKQIHEWNYPLRIYTEQHGVETIHVLDGRTAEVAAELSRRCGLPVEAIDEDPEGNIEHTRRYWQREGRIIRFGPVNTLYLGDLPDNLNMLPDAGWLGLVDDRLIFLGESSANLEISLPLERIRWIGQANVKVQQWNALTMYIEWESGWRLHTFEVWEFNKLVTAMQEIGGVALVRYSDYGPFDAPRYDQNIYGQWERGYTMKLYLMEDRLLADWRTVVTLDQIRGLAVLPSAGLSLTHSALLSVHYTMADNRLHAVGFAMDGEKAGEWARVLQTRTGIEPEYGGRKQKRSD
jgi:hypothetical protein